MKAGETTRFITVPDWPKFHPWPSQAGLRHLIFKGRYNGFDQVTRRSGRRVLIDEGAFFQWMKQCGVGGKSNGSV